MSVRAILTVDITIHVMAAVAIMTHNVNVVVVHNALQITPAMVVAVIMIRQLHVLATTKHVLLLLNVVDLIDVVPHVEYSYHRVVVVMIVPVAVVSVVQPVQVDKYAIMVLAVPKKAQYILAVNKE